MNKAFFLDRDGVLNVEVDYLHRPEEVELIPGVIEALRRIHAAGYQAVVVSNQSGVARGMFSLEDVRKVELRICALLEACGVSLDAFYYCPHHRDGVVEKWTCVCDCRKPAPGLLLRAARERHIDLSRSFLIGDQMSDLKAADAAGCAESVLVLTGHGRENVEKGLTSGRVVCPTILDAVEYLLKK